MRTRLRTRMHYLTDHPWFRRRPLTALARTVRWSFLVRKGRPVIVALPRWDAALEVPARKGSAALFVFREHYEPELGLLERFLEPGGVFVDGGANVGLYSVAASRLVGEGGTVLAVEPAAEPAAFLERNLAANGSTNVRVRRVALSDTEGSATLFLHGDDHGRSSLGWGEPGTRTESVRTVTLDTLLDAEGLDRLNLVKLDVEGAEELALRGAARALARYRPALIVEIYPEGAARLGLAGDGSRRLLHMLGYRMFAASRPAVSTAAWNAVAVPAEWGHPAPTPP